VKEFNVSNEAFSQPAELQAAAERDGYLFFKGWIEPSALLDLRRQILDICRDLGWLAEGGDPMDGIARPGVKYVEPSPEYRDVYDRVQKLEAFHELAHTPRLLETLDRLFGEPTLVHPRNIARLIFPDNVLYTTPAHQDFIHIHGTPETYTAWIPLGDCPKNHGSLAVMAGSHRSGIYETHAAYGAGGRGIDTEDLPFEWHGSDFKLGDVLFFHSHAIHRALPNESPDRLRLSVDYRYQGVSQPVMWHSLLPHFGQLTWEEIYQEWPPDARRFYWKDLPLNVEGPEPKREPEEEGAKAGR
jgi:hypothetical protein